MARFNIIVIAVVLMAALRAAAQTPGTGAISGTVFDPAHRVIAGAEVRAVNLSSQSARTVRTSAEGSFRFALLYPGDYVVTITAVGFAAGTISSVQVAAGEVRSLNATLFLEKATTEVNVSANQQIADLESSTLGSLVDRRTID